MMLALAVNWLQPRVLSRLGFLPEDRQSCSVVSRERGVIRNGPEWLVTE
jgi:hypothetical protein